MYTIFNALALVKEEEKKPQIIIIIKGKKNRIPLSFVFVVVVCVVHIRKESGPKCLKCIQLPTQTRCCCITHSKRSL